MARDDSPQGDPYRSASLFVANWFSTGVLVACLLVILVWGVFHVA